HAGSLPATRTGKIARQVAAGCRWQIVRFAAHRYVDHVVGVDGRQADGRVFGQRTVWTGWRIDGLHAKRPRNCRAIDVDAVDSVVLADGLFGREQVRV